MKSRYIPITQQPYCCVAACIQMVMYRRGVLLVPQEDIAFELGLAVPKEDEHLFKRTHQRENGRVDWGVNISWKQYNLDDGLKRAGVPLQARYYLADQIESVADLKETLTDLQKEDADILLSYDYDEVWGGGGSANHVCVFDRIEGDVIWMVDPEQNVPKHRATSVEILFRGIKKENAGHYNGLWLLEGS